MNGSTKCIFFVFHIGWNLLNVIICPFLDHTQGSHCYWHGGSFFFFFFLLLLLLLLLLSDLQISHSTGKLFTEVRVTASLNWSQVFLLILTVLWSGWTRFFLLLRLVSPLLLCSTVCFLFSGKVQVIFYLFDF